MLNDYEQTYLLRIAAPIVNSETDKTVCLCKIYETIVNKAHTVLLHKNTRVNLFYQ